MNKPLPSIAQTLSNLELVSGDDLAEICRDSRDASEILQTVFKRGLISSEALTKELSLRFGTPLFSLDAIKQDAIPRELIEMKIVEKHFVLPIYKHLLPCWTPLTKVRLMK